VSVLALCGAPATDDTVSAPACRRKGPSVWIAVAPEASGAALSRTTPGVVWTHNDSGEPAVFALDSSGALLGAVRVTGAAVVDWEAVAIGPCASASCLYIGDIGDNNARRKDVVVYRVAEPSPRDRNTAGAEAFRATYPDGRHDAEAMFVTADGTVYVITKGDTGPIAIYRFPQPLRPNASVRLERVATLAAGTVKRHERVTDASISPNGRWVVLRTAGSLAFYPARELAAGTVADPQTFDIRSLREVQGEGVALADDGTVYLIGEGGGKKRPGTFARMLCTLPG
jgi:hypothetical protein